MLLHEGVGETDSVLPKKESYETGITQTDNMQESQGNTADSVWPDDQVAAAAAFVFSRVPLL